MPSCPTCQTDVLDATAPCPACGASRADAAVVPSGDDLVTVAGGETLLMKPLVEAMTEAGVPHRLDVDPDAPRFTDAQGVPAGYDPLRAFAGADPYVVTSWSLRVRPEDEAAARAVLAQSDAWFDADYIEGVLHDSARLTRATQAASRIGRGVGLALLGAGAAVYAWLSRAPLASDGAQDLAMGLAVCALIVGGASEALRLSNGIGRWTDARIKRGLDDDEVT